MATAHLFTPPSAKPPRNQNKLFWSDATLVGCRMWRAIGVDWALQLWDYEKEHDFS